MMDIDREAVERFERSVVILPTSSCWFWTGTLSHGGYGVMSVHGFASGAHRVAWEIFRGPLPSGLPLDHLCRVRRCVNPAHLEPVTPAENARRSPIMGGPRGKRRHFSPPL